MSASRLIAAGLYPASSSAVHAPIPYGNFFGLRENPFSLNPDPRYLHRTRQAHDTLSQLTRGILTRAGLIVLSGEVGTGKTTLLNASIRLLKMNPAIGSKIGTALIVHPTLTPNEFLETILDGFRVPCSSIRRPRRLEALLQMLLELQRHGGIAVLMIDEAQLLTTELLDEIRLLLSLQTSHEQLLQVVLCGQPEIEAKLDRHESCRLLASSAIRCKTVPLTLDDTRDYIQHRLKVAGARSASIFARDAVDAAHLYSQGVPRIVNVLCAHALATADINRIQQISPNMIEAAAATIPFANIKLPPLRVVRFLSATAAVPAVATVPSALSQPALTPVQPQTPAAPAPAARPQPMPAYATPQVAAAAPLQTNNAQQAGGSQSLPTDSPPQSAARSHPINGSRQGTASVYPEERRAVPKCSGTSVVLTPEACQAVGQNNSEIGSRVPDHPAPARIPMWISACNWWLNRWCSDHFTPEKCWKVLCQAALTGAILLTLAQRLGSAARWEHPTRMALGFLGLLLLDISLGLGAYLLVHERHSNPPTNTPAKLFWASYKRLFSLFS